MDRKNSDSSEQQDQEAAEIDLPLPIYQLLEGVTNFSGGQSLPSRPARGPLDHRRSVSSGGLIYIPPSHKPSKSILAERSATPEPGEQGRCSSRESHHSPIPSEMELSSDSLMPLMEQMDAGKSCKEEGGDLQPEESLEKEKPANGIGENTEQETEG